jgi:hypothetical protein
MVHQILIGFASRQVLEAGNGSLPIESRIESVAHRQLRLRYVLLLRLDRNRATTDSSYWR